MKKGFIVILILIIFIFNCCFVTSAALYGNGYPIKILPEEQASSIYENQNFVIRTKDLDFSGFDKSIVSFAVSDDGYIALALAGQSVLVLDPLKKPVSLIDFDNDYFGSYGVDFNGNNVCLYSVRGNTIYEFTMEGNLVSIATPATDTEKVTDHFQSILGRNRKEIVIDDTVYRIENDHAILDVVTAGRFKRLIKITNGHTEIIYQKSTDVTSILVIIILFGSGIALIVGMIIVGIKSGKEEQRNKSNVEDESSETEWNAQDWLKSWLRFR